MYDKQQLMKDLDSILYRDCNYNPFGCFAALTYEDDRMIVTNNYKILGMTAIILHEKRGNMAVDIALDQVSVDSGIGAHIMNIMLNRYDYK